MDFFNFQMLDEVVSLDKENKIICCKTRVPESSFIFDAHFPGFPILPGVFMIETIAQAAGFLTLTLNHFEKMPFLFGVEETRFRDFVAPGSVLDVQAKIEQLGAGYVVASGEITRDHKRIANVQVRLRLVALPSGEIKTMLQSRAQALHLDTQVHNAIPA